MSEDKNDSKDEIKNKLKHSDKKPANDPKKGSDDPDKLFDDDFIKKMSNGDGGGGKLNILNLVIISFFIVFLINIMFNMFNTKNKVQIDYNQFVKLVESGDVKSVRILSGEITLTLKKEADKEAIYEIISTNLPEMTDEKLDAKRKEEWLNSLSGNIEFYTGSVYDPILTERLLKQDISFNSVIDNTSPIIAFVLSWIMPFVLIYLFYVFFLKRMLKKLSQDGGGGFGGMMGVGKSKAKLYDVEKDTEITFKDVAGQDEAKESLTEMIDFLHAPEKYGKIGAKQPKGALLVGPPGTGKTLLAKAVAGEAKVPFFSITGSEFVEMYVGVGASRVRDLFQQASKSAPCIIFIDEIDAIGKSRDNQYQSNEEREQTLNQLLAEMDGFDSSKGIVVLASTNRPEILDKALLRPGRFDRRIIVEKPDLPGREAILQVHAKKVKTGPDVVLKEIALATSGATGADLANMVNEAALRAVRHKREIVLQEDLMEAVEVIIAGKEKKDRIMNSMEKRIVAFHEVGHALTSALQKHSTPVQKITIVPRTMGMLGYMMNLPEEERYLHTKNELLAEIVILVGGRAAEEIIFGEASTGAANDIERATSLARNMVTKYGMSENFDMMSLESTQSKYLDGRSVLTCSEATGAEIDIEVKRIIKDCHNKAVELLKENKDKLSEIAEFLIEKETITGTQFMEILGMPENVKQDETAKERESLLDIDTERQ